MQVNELEAGTSVSRKESSPQFRTFARYKLPTRIFEESSNESLRDFDVLIDYGHNILFLDETATDGAEAGGEGGLHWQCRPERRQDLKYPRL